MWRRKMAIAAGAAVMAAAIVAFPAAAHGYGHHRQEQAAVTDTSCPVCTVEGCTETGRHTHDGHDYCGYEHSSGYCDGTCQNNSDTGCYNGGHHGCHR